MADVRGSTPLGSTSGNPSDLRIRGRRGFSCAGWEPVRHTGRVLLGLTLWVDPNTRRAPPPGSHRGRGAAGQVRHPPAGRLVHTTGVDEWCNPPGRALGTPPTTDTGVPGVAAHLWGPH
ncbi:glycoside hydrolase family 6 protein [Streptomyces canus]|uniref:glycoside hydrolase family 6 protein n=1 Tax=Streptomyces canus TaxID=58343 RepID=UPI003AF3C6A3